MKSVYGKIWSPILISVWNIKKSKITICKVRLLKSVSNGRKKLSESWNFKKMNHLIGRKKSYNRWNWFHVKFKEAEKLCTMLQKLSKCEVKAWLCWDLCILQPIRFYVKSNLGECKLKFLREIEFWQI